MARKPRVELTPELIANYCRALDKTTPQIAASVVGVSPRQIKAWLDAGASDDATDLERELLAAEAAVQSGGTRGRLMKQLFDAAEVEPKVALELAKMLMPSLVAPKQIDVTATVGPATPRVDWSRASDEQLMLAEQYAKTVAALSADAGDPNDG